MRPLALRITLVALLAILALTLPAAIAAMAAGSGPGWDKLGKYNLRVGSKFLAATAAEPDILQLDRESGILYRVLESGAGMMHPGRSSEVMVHHAGKTIKGAVFEDTWSRGVPERLTTGGLLGCWTRALLQMVVGDEWELVCPAKMAYAQYGSSRDSIGPHEVLMFRVRSHIANTTARLRLLDIPSLGDARPKDYVHPPHRAPGSPPTAAELAADKRKRKDARLAAKADRQAREATDKLTDALLAGVDGLKMDL